MYVSCGYLLGERIQKEGAIHPRCYVCHNLAMSHLGLKGIDFVSFFNLCWKTAWDTDGTKFTEHRPNIRWVKCDFSSIAPFYSHNNTEM